MAIKTAREVLSEYHTPEVITEPVFEIHSSDGEQSWKIYESGEIEGFPEDVWIINRVIPLTGMLRYREQMDNVKK